MLRHLLQFLTQSLTRSGQLPQRMVDSGHAFQQPRRVVRLERERRLVLVVRNGERVGVSHGR